MLSLKYTLIMSKNMFWRCHVHVENVGRNMIKPKHSISTYTYSLGIA